jgi:hypothetical protein
MQDAGLKINLRRMRNRSWALDKVTTRWIKAFRVLPACLTALLKLHHAVPREMNQKHAAVGKR